MEDPKALIARIIANRGLEGKVSLTFDVSDHETPLQDETLCLVCKTRYNMDGITGLVRGRIQGKKFSLTQERWPELTKRKHDRESK